MGKQTNKAASTVSVEIPVDEGWVDFCLKYSDLFRTDHCGYWAFGAKVDGGWLVFEEQGDGVHPSEEEQDAAIAAHEKGAPLPPHWFLLDRAMAIKAFGEGVKRKGACWYEDGDCTDYDCAIQMALLGEIRYG